MNITMPARQHGVYSSVAREFGEAPSYNFNVVNQDLWRSSDPIWHLDSFAIEHQAVDQFGYSREPQPWTGITSSHDYPQATSFSTPSEEWCLSSPLDTACADYKSSPTPTIAASHPLSPQHNFVASPTETRDLKPEMGRDNEFSYLVSPTSPEPGPRSQKKRNRNRLAAAKCRKKAKRGVDDLQQRERDLLRENKMLNAEAGLLREEVLQLKSEILRHSNCDSEYIHHYIQKAAKEIGAQAQDSACEIPGVSAVN
ncbi:hypothetical protein FHL15_007900 [Xylaria flabelliformis]|uniref:BZIP domain-containing protein n=1 Tax=Xylaria flabelliformis TaxID=2512241 RepID=A0A553HTL8_9PEZI|nr:hypothetical protein FHL15_007900 [Xylaria flabelliformis]